MPTLDTFHFLAYKRIMPVLRKALGSVAAILVVCAFALAADFEWNWRNQDTIGRTDPSVNNTSRLTEPERTALIDAFVLRLQKPMSERGYDDDRIREIASTTRLRFVDLGGGGKPFLFATSLGLEGGCDARANCPFWIFRLTDKGYVSILDTDGASYTIQPTRSNGISDVVILRHESASESHLTVYSYAEGKYSEAGCYIATWPSPNDTETQDPTINPCKAEESKPEEAKPAEPASGESKPAEPKTEELQPPAPPSAPESKTDESKPAAPATNETKPDQPKQDQPNPYQPKPPDSKETP